MTVQAKIECRNKIFKAFRSFDIIEVIIVNFFRTRQTNKKASQSRSLF